MISSQPGCVRRFLNCTISWLIGDTAIAVEPNVCCCQATNSTGCAAVLPLHSVIWPCTPTHRLVTQPRTQISTQLLCTITPHPPKLLSSVLKLSQAIIYIRQHIKQQLDTSVPLFSLWLQTTVSNSSCKQKTTTNSSGCTGCPWVSTSLGEAWEENCQSTDGKSDIIGVLTLGQAGFQHGLPHTADTNVYMSPGETATPGLSLL